MNPTEFRIQLGYDTVDVGWFLEHLPCGWRSNVQGAGEQRTLADLRRWAEHHASECRNQPTGFISRKAWSVIPAGWFVQAKDAGPWYEVMSTRAMHSDLQLVKIRTESGQEIETQRPRADEVACRRGTLAPAVVSDALEALGPGVEILEDEQ